MSTTLPSGYLLPPGKTMADVMYLDETLIFSETLCIHCPDCNTLSDWQTGMSWPCDLCSDRTLLPIYEQTFPS